AHDRREDLWQLLCKGENTLPCLGAEGLGLLLAAAFILAMIDRQWDGIAAYCRLENKVSLGFVEGLNNKIRVIQRRAYGLRNEDYLRLKVLTCMLPAL